MTEFIAEIGINHGGDFQLALDMVVAAKQSGANVAKFQMYDPIKILGRDSIYLEEALKSQFSKEEHIELKSYCDKIGIEYMCSVFDPADIPFFEGIGMKRYKIASRSVKDVPLLEAIKATRKPVVASNGLDWGLMQLKSIFQPGADLTVLECIAKYPSSLEDMRFPSWDRFKEKGLSSHCPSIVPSLTAIMHGAKIVEHHVKFEWQKEGCDMSSSITFEQFKEMTTLARRELP